MPTFKVHVRQWIEEIAEVIVEAEDEAAARAQIESDDPETDFDWEDGAGVDDFEIVTVEELEK